MQSVPNHVNFMQNGTSLTWQSKMDYINNTTQIQHIMNIFVHTQNNTQNGLQNLAASTRVDGQIGRSIGCFSLNFDV